MWIKFAFIMKMFLAKQLHKVHAMHYEFCKIWVEKINISVIFVRKCRFQLNIRPF